MKRILLSLGSLLFVSALLAGTTGAFLADTQTSTGNTFASGVIALQFDNESYYTNDWGKLVVSTSTSWSLSNLPGKLFFNFPDVKPGDIGEDTISIHVNNNNAWACMDIKLTSTPENGVNEPESLVDNSTSTQAGELQNYLYFAFWGDDGDNVYEKGEHIFKQGYVKDIFDGKPWVIADSSGNIWGTTDPLLGGSTNYIGKAWCFGTMTAAPLDQDGQGKTGSNGPLVRGTGFHCDGSQVGNIVQSDGITADVTFNAIQSRNNDGFKCGDPNSTTTPELGSISGEKFNDLNYNGYLDSGEPGLPNWTIGISAGGATTTVQTDQNGFYHFTNLVPGNYLVCEVQQTGWKQTYPTPSCWKITLTQGQNVIGKDFGNWKKPAGNQYCSPGYWKQSQHFGDWTNYSPNQLFSSVFDNAFPGQTLLQVLQNGGGGLQALGRATVAELLNAGKINAPFTQAQVISMFDATYPGTSTAYDTLAAQFTQADNCPLGSSGGGSYGGGYGW